VGLQGRSGLELGDEEFGEDGTGVLEVDSAQVLVLKLPHLQSKKQRLKSEKGRNLCKLPVQHFPGIKLGTYID